jgi:O-methyltransferase
MRLRRALPESLVRRLPPTYVYKSDGMATAHFSPFLYDDEFNRVYWSVADRWPGGPLDLRWRVWLLMRCAQQCVTLPGNVVEFGVYRGASAFVLLSSVSLRADQRLVLFDTFSGIPSAGLTTEEVGGGLSGRLADTSAADVEELLKWWGRQVELVVGDVTNTTASVETGRVCFAHVDLNAAAATVSALEYLYDRLLTGGIVVLDDYGWSGYEAQRAAIDTFFSGRPEQVVALPTGQGIVIKL